jgi:hypothetical protein
MEAFFVENRSKNLIFFYGESESGVNKSAKGKFKLQIIDSSSISLKGVCIFFVRHFASTAITPKNISDVIHEFKFNLDSFKQKLRFFFNYRKFFSVRMIVKTKVFFKQLADNLPYYFFQYYLI